MNLNNLVEILQKHPEAEKMGMIACHLGLVRRTSLTRRDVTGVEVRYDEQKLDSIKNDIKFMTGVVDIIIETRDGYLEVGDHIMAVAVGGDVRQNVFSALINAVDRIKKEATDKREIYR
jgi:molybdopterin synthase catalytic subunit